GSLGHIRVVEDGTTRLYGTVHGGLVRDCARAAPPAGESYVRQLSCYPGDRISVAGGLGGRYGVAIGCAGTLFCAALGWNIWGWLDSRSATHRGEPGRRDGPNADFVEHA